ncbi:MAG: TIM barrel protein [Christensenellales bacterium]|jgi:deoxyribonuclease-4
MENKIRFGPSGNSQIFYEEGNKKSLEAPAWLKSKGLSAYEYSFGRGFTMSAETAQELGREAVKNDILVSVHAPYYINFANPSDEMAEKSYGYVLRGLEYVEWFQGQKICVHLATQGKMSREEALELTRKRLEILLEKAYDKFDMSRLLICPETMGKYSQIGNVKEIVDFCTLDKCLVPTFDFGHINCLMQGGLKTEDDFKQIWDYTIEKLGYERAKNAHVHFSKIEYSDKGEIKHLNFDDMFYGPEFAPLASVLHEYKLTPSIISESADNMAQDAMEMQRIYNSILLGKM